MFFSNWNKEPDEEKNYRSTEFSHKLDNSKWKMHTGTRARKQNYRSMYISLYENLFENGCIYIYIYKFLSGTGKSENYFWADTCKRFFHTNWNHMFSSSSVKVLKYQGISSIYMKKSGTLVVSFWGVTCGVWYHQQGSERGQFITFQKQVFAGGCASRSNESRTKKKQVLSWRFCESD